MIGRTPQVGKTLHQLNWPSLQSTQGVIVFYPLDTLGTALPMVRVETFRTSVGTAERAYAKTASISKSVAVWTDSQKIGSQLGFLCR